VNDTADIESDAQAGFISMRIPALPAE